ncbi:MAG: hypothetical protein K9J18_07585 [Crocinitomicaceae bacterium]|nr:hypothetical protein [Crocinitomicaceae bacterium]
MKLSLTIISNSVFFLVLLATPSCTNQELTNPLTVKGMKLGLDYNSQIDLGSQNGACENDLPNSNKCQYKILDNIYASPELYYSLYKDKKVLAEVKLILNSPFNFPVVQDANKNIIAEYPSLMKSEIYEVIQLYKKKYGPGKKTLWEYGGVQEWDFEDMHIELDYTKTTYAYGYQFHPQIRWAFQGDAYNVAVTYSYSEEMKKLLKNEKSHNGEPIGDKI